MTRDENNKRKTKKNNKTKTFHKYGKHTTRGLRIKTKIQTNKQHCPMQDELPDYIQKH
jgi:hypothetical protein